MENRCIQATVSGHVQGVFFRDCTKQKAQELGLEGWVRNCKDGTVEVYACGQANQIATFIDWLWEGSPRSTVATVAWKETSCEAVSGFSIRR